MSKEIDPIILSSGDIGTYLLPTAKITSAKIVITPKN